MLQDKELHQRILDRDQSALEALYSRYYNRLCRFVMQTTQDIDTTEEVVNDVFMVVWKSADKFRGDSSLSTWIMGIGYKKALTALSRKRHWLPLHEAADIVGEKDATDMERDEIQKAMGKIHPDQRAIVELTYYFGYTYKEIGEIVGAPENTIKSRMFYARKQMKQYLNSVQ